MKSLSLHLTDLCNQSCNFCVVGTYAGHPEKVNHKLIYKFLESNAGQGYEMVNLHGGEPTLSRELIPVLDRIRELGYPAVSIQTNARRFKEIRFAEELTTRGVELFVVSLHGADAAMHESFTKARGSWAETIEGIKNLKKLGKKVRTNTVITKQNFPTLKEIVALAIEIGVDHINLSNIHPVNMAFKNFHEVTPRLQDIVPAVKATVDTVAAAGRVVTLEGFPPCTLGEYEKYMVDWEENQFKLLYHEHVMTNYDEFMRKETRKLGDPCRACVRKDVCGGPYKEYLLFYGWEEFAPVTAEAGD